MTHADSEGHAEDAPAEARARLALVSRSARGLWFALDPRLRTRARLSHEGGLDDGPEKPVTGARLRAVGSRRHAET